MQHSTFGQALRKCGSVDVPLLARPQSAVIIMAWEMGRALRSRQGVLIQQMFLFGVWMASRRNVQITVLEVQKLTEKGQRWNLSQMRNQKSSPCGVRAERWLVRAGVYFNVALAMLSVKLPLLSMSSVSLLKPPWRRGGWFSEAVVLDDSASGIQSDGSLEYWGETVEFSGSSLPPKMIKFGFVQYCVSAVLISLICPRRQSNYNFATVTEPCCFRNKVRRWNVVRGCGRRNGWREALWMEEEKEKIYMKRWKRYRNASIQCKSFTHCAAALPWNLLEMADLWLRTLQFKSLIISRLLITLSDHSATPPTLQQPVSSRIKEDGAQRFCDSKAKWDLQSVV